LCTFSSHAYPRVLRPHMCPELTLQHSLPSTCCTLLCSISRCRCDDACMDPNNAVLYGACARVGILVFPRRACGINQDILRALEDQPESGRFSFPQNDRPCRACHSFPKSLRGSPEHRCLFQEFLTTSIRRADDHARRASRIAC
jgi:hypothetical protein